ncbi:MAG TPA: hypothetical protein V6C65_39395 [Allocoleopsis sp.]
MIQICCVVQQLRLDFQRQGIVLPVLFLSVIHHPIDRSLSALELPEVPEISPSSSNCPPADR